MSKLFGGIFTTFNQCLNINRAGEKSLAYAKSTTIVAEQESNEKVCFGGLFANIRFFQNTNQMINSRNFSQTRSQQSGLQMSRNLNHSQIMKPMD
jgi:hypothetical protein